ncbi:hypothetical protein [Aliiroseovarius pelagivivens]|nr:hypothetical protein [Aliiroseovarius pelagivivens]
MDRSFLLMAADPKTGEAASVSPKGGTLAFRVEYDSDVTHK